MSRLGACLLLGSLTSLLLLSGCGGDTADEQAAFTIPAVRGTTGGKLTFTDTDEPLYDKYPDVPRVGIIESIDGIEIPRLPAGQDLLAIGGSIPADVGNEAAARNPSQPVTGGQLTVRYPAEPQTLNSIIETSSYETYISSYVRDALAGQHPETLEWYPKLAREWITEDSIRLTPDTTGFERRVAIDGAVPASSGTLQYPDAPEEPPEDFQPPRKLLRLTTIDGKPADGTYVRLEWAGEAGTRPEEVPTKGFEFWSDLDGEVAVSGIPGGEYRVLIGADIYGETELAVDGTLTVRPKTAENPLVQGDVKPGDVALTLKPDQYTAIERETVITYYIRDNAKWADGVPFTAADLEFAYGVINSRFVDGDSLRVYYADVVECRAVKPLVCRMKYREQYFKAFEFTAGLGYFAPPLHVFKQRIKEEFKEELTLEKLTEEEEASRKLVSVSGPRFGKFYNTDTRYNEQPLGTGPYAIEKWDRGSSITVTRRKDYWDDQDQGYLDKITFKFIGDPVTALQALKSGEIDFDWILTPDQYFDELAGPPDWFKSKFVKAAWFSPGFTYIGWNLLDPRFQDRRVRVAFRLLSDLEGFVAQKYRGEAKVVSGSQYYFGPAYDHKVQPMAYAPEVAENLLAEAGWVDTDGDGLLDRNGETLKIELLFSQSSSTAKSIVTLLQHSFKKAGIDVQIRPLEFASFIEKVKSKEYDACTLGWSQSLESDPQQIWHSSEGGLASRGSNHVSYANPEVDRLIEMMRLELDPEKRHTIQMAMHRTLDRDQPYLFMLLTKDYGAYHQKFRNVKWYVLRPGFDFRYWYIPKDLQ
ncbi:MAG: ABC transporter substrate-binding protein [Planctomycetaceae bacterium]